MGLFIRRDVRAVVGLKRGVIYACTPPQPRLEPPSTRSRDTRATCEPGAAGPAAPPASARRIPLP